MEPGDFYEFTVDIVNDGSIDAMISEVLRSGISTDQEKYIEYIATYEDGGELEVNDLLKSGSRKNIKVRVKFREDVNSEDLPLEEVTLNLSFSVTYIQADDNAIDKNNYICKRAEVLHTEKCSNSDSTYTCSGAGYKTNGSKKTTTITYGTLGEDGVLPVSGDAFDCDVDGDGTYDSETERFYYVSDLYDTTSKSFNDKYGVLVYYSNTKAGSAVTTTSAGIAYDSSGKNFNGPTSAISNLPKIDQWKNVSLVNDKRAFLAENDASLTNGGTLPGAFDYTGYTARPLTYQEASFACGGDGNPNTTGELRDCEYLMENTRFATETSRLYGYWLENPRSSSSSTAWYVCGRDRSIIATTVSVYNTLGIRPVIEVPKVNILY